MYLVTGQTPLSSAQKTEHMNVTADRDSERYLFDIKA